MGIGTAAPGRKLELNNGGTGAFVTFTDGVATNFTFKTDGNQVGTFGTEAGSTHLGFMASGTERVRIHSGGVMSVNSGIELGSGLDATAANTLDDYEEGNFTPSFSNGISSPTYSTQLGRYTKIGNMVLFSIHLRANGGTATSGHVTITGLPFTSNSSLNQEGAWFTYNGGFYNTSSATGAWLILGNGNSMAFYRQTDGAALAGTSSGLATNLNADCRVAGFYRT